MMYVVIFWKHAALARTWIVLAMASAVFIWKSSKDFQFSSPNDPHFSSPSPVTKEATLKFRKPKAKLTNLSSPFTNKTIQKTRRTKIHICYESGRNKHGYGILKDEFGFVDVNASAGEDWDVIFGGYPYCGFVSPDYQMKTGLNKMLLDKGFDKLKPHQVFHPCMGCTLSYCNKEQLCRLQRIIDPDTCYLLPEDREALVKKMKQKPNATWVLKHDSAVSAVHSGRGVQIIESPRELPTNSSLETDRYLVQPFVESMLGPADLRRKTEVRYYVTITSVTPLRVYYFNDQWMPLSSTLWVDNPPSALYKKCQQDSHLKNTKCSLANTTTPVKGKKRIRFRYYKWATGMPEEMAKSFHQEAITTMARIFELSHDIMRNNTINQGITSSGASCFSFMRADFGISPAGKPFLYEINEFPYGKEPKVAGEVQKQAYRDLFRMIGFADGPVPAQERAAYEAEHKGNWTLLPTFVNDS